MTTISSTNFFKTGQIDSCYCYQCNEKREMQNSSSSTSVCGITEDACSTLDTTGKLSFDDLNADILVDIAMDAYDSSLNGTNINEYDYTEYQRLFAPVFQDYVRYYFSLGTNIVLASQFDKDKLDRICQECGLTDLVNKLPKGYDTQVDKFIDEEGFEPSGGEDQRIAIARACYKGGEIYLLDEPTAAIDPMAEYEIYTQFNNMTKNKIYYAKNKRVKKEI